MARVAYGAEVDQLRGKVGNVVFSKARSGATVRIRRSPRNPNTPAQAAIRQAMKKSSRTFKGMSMAQEGAWRTYANGITRVNPLSGETYHPAPIDAFNELNIKFLQINPTGTVPLVPPANPFAGDSVAVTVAGGGTQVTFAASAANAAGVKTELLLVSVPSPHRTVYENDYRTMGFVAFVAGTLSQKYMNLSGWYAAAYRFVKTATGEATDFIPLGMIDAS